MTAEAKAHECYAKLQYPNNTYITKIGDKAFLTVPYIYTKMLDNGQLQVSNPTFGTDKILIAADQLTTENIKRIVSFRPQAMMGGTILDYQAKVVPMFVRQLSMLFPEKMDAFMASNPDYEIKPPDWRGRRAKLATCNREALYNDTNGNVFSFDGDYIVCSNYRSAFIPFEAKNAEIRMLVSDCMEVKITDNNQVTDDTIFV